jgi:predicted  nucleic acid-binding Zn-ribbon protein
MSTLGDMQKQLSQVMEEAKSQGYKIEDVIPQSMQNHFSEMSELTAAREYIGQMQARERDLEAGINALRAKLKEKEAEIDDQPAEFKALKIDLQQAHRSIDYYRDLSEDSRRRAERYQRDLSLTVKDQVAYNEVIAKIERLQNELNQYQTTIQRLQRENERAAETFALLRTQDARLIAVHEAQGAAILSHASQIENENEQFNQTFTTLIDNLESEVSSAAASVNDKTALLRQTEILHNAIFSEVAPLNRLFSRAFKMLQIYQRLFQLLSDPYASGVAGLPLELDPLMEGAQQDLYIYNEVHRTVGQGSRLAGEQVRMHLNGISKSASDILDSLNSIKTDVANFLARIKKEPGTWATLKAKFGISGEKKVIEKSYSVS